MEPNSQERYSNSKKELFNFFLMILSSNLRLFIFELI